ncbi:helix-turn-helix domain-containing protein [Methylibium petroleiphilum]|uniref:helix-turn-helix domain-containing protein n=1 Tax=Methylibium petroleiphilum TaxID=105560 RepID=UPI001ACA15FB|nr:helix-turn-helix domain-containing protein [Methylibium petroleiphilum]MBN9205720.1 helix-turn-helix domain-containing protein [Methylibium petroleiphilum]
MDSLIAAAARALAAGDALGALKRVALRDDPPALALRGIAMAQLGEHARARELLKRAARRFGSSHEALAHARCVVAEAEVALAMRDLRGAPGTLAAAAAALDARGDRANALQARLIAVRRLLLLGRLQETEAALSQLDDPLRGDDEASGPPALRAVAALATAELAWRSLRTAPAQAALARAHAAAQRAGVPALQAEVAEARAALERPAARRLLPTGHEQPLRLAEVEALLASGALVVDACRRGLHGSGGTWLPLARRPLLFALARALAEAWPGDADRHALIAQAFRTRRPDETHRARLRVEIGRLRKLAAPLARVEATERGFLLVPQGQEGDAAVVVLVPPLDGDRASLLALLADGAAWSTSALALALGASQRTVQRALVELEAAGRVRAIGRARAQRWLAPPLAGFTTNLLLPAALPLT